MDFPHPNHTEQPIWSIWDPPRCMCHLCQLGHATIQNHIPPQLWSTNNWLPSKEAHQFSQFIGSSCYFAKLSLSSMLSNPTNCLCHLEFQLRESLNLDSIFPFWDLQSILNFPLLCLYVKLGTRVDGMLPSFYCHNYLAFQGFDLDHEIGLLDCVPTLFFLNTLVKPSSSLACLVSCSPCSRVILSPSLINIANFQKNCPQVFGAIG